MSRCVKNSDGEIDAKAGRRTRSIVSTETVDSPLRRSCRVKSAGKHNDSSPESSLSDNSNINNTQSVRNTRHLVDSLNNSTMTERSRTLRSRRNSVALDAIETPDKHAVIATPTKRSRNISNNDGLNKSNDQTSFSKRLTRAGSESKSPPIITRPTRRTRASSMGPEAAVENNVLEINNSGLMHTPVNTRKRRSMLPLETTVIEEGESKIPYIALDRILPNLQEMNETCLENSTMEEPNKSISISKETFNSSSENTCKKEIEGDVNAEKEHTTLTEIPSAKTLQENGTDMSINKNTLSDISGKSRSDSTDTITQMKTSILNVQKTQSRISTEVAPRKLQLKNESSTNNSIKEEDDHLSNKENRVSNIIEDLQNKDVPVSNILSQSPQPLIVSDTCTRKSVKENDEDADSTDNMQNLIVTDTDSLSETPLNDSIGRDTSCIEIDEDSSLDENIQILECSENINNINSLNPHNDDEDKNVLSVEIRNDLNQDGDIQIQKCEEDIIGTHTEKSLGVDNNEEQALHIAAEEGTITEDDSVKIRLTSEVDETVNIDKKELGEVCLTQITIVNSKCEVNEETGVPDRSEILNDTGDMEHSKLSDMSVHKMCITSKISVDETTTNDLQETDVAPKIPRHKNVTKELYDVHTRTNNFELANENENNITDVIENSRSFSVAEVLTEPIDKTLEKIDIIQNISKVDNCLASEGKSIIDSNLKNDLEKDEVPETVQKQEEKMHVDDNRSDANIDTDLFKDILVDEWKEINSDKNSVHSMSTERLENESENECDDFVLVDKEVSQTAENRDIEKEKEAFDYDSDDTVLLKAQKDALTEKTMEPLDMSESQCETNENKSAMVKDAEQFRQQDEFNEAERVINDAERVINNAEVKSENLKEHMKSQTEEIQNGENVSLSISITNEVLKQSPLKRDTSIEKPVDKNLTNDIDTNLNILSTESPRNKRKSKKLSEEVSNDQTSLCKSIEKSDSKVEEHREAGIVEEKDSLNKSPLGSPSNISDLSKTNESMDSDIEEEYNLHGVEVSKFSDDDVPGDECRASETESSDPDDNGSDLADFVVNDDDEISAEVESSEIDEVLYNSLDDKHRESDTDAIDCYEQRGKMQIQEESDEKAMKKGKQNRIHTDISKKEKSKFKKSVKLSLDKITESDNKITKAEIEPIDKKRKRNKMKRCVEEQEIDKQSRKVQIHQEMAEKQTKKKQRKSDVKENVQVIQNKCTDTPKKGKSKLEKTIKLDLSEMSESGKNVKRKSEIKTGNKIKKIKGKNNGDKMLKENVVIRENRPTEYGKVEVSKKRVKRLSEEVIENLSDLPMKISKKRKLLSPEQKKLPSRSNPHSMLKKRKVNVEQDFISLSSYGSTSNFYVANLQKVKKAKKISEVQEFRQRMLNRNPRQSISCYTMFLEKQTASNKQ